MKPKLPISFKNYEAKYSNKSHVLLIGGKLTALEICKFIIKCSLNTLKNRISLPISFLESDFLPDSSRSRKLKQLAIFGNGH